MLAQTPSPNLVPFLHTLCGTSDHNSDLEIKGRVSHKKFDGPVLKALKSSGMVHLDILSIS